MVDGKIKKKSLIFFFAITNIFLCILYQINLLEGKRSLNINISLRQFRMSNEEIIQLLREGPSEKIGAEKLRGLLKIMPYSDEVNVNYIH